MDLKKLKLLSKEKRELFEKIVKGVASEEECAKYDRIIIEIKSIIIPAL